MKKKLKQMIAKMPGVRSIVAEKNDLRIKNDILTKENKQLQKKIEKYQQQLEENNEEIEKICHANVMADLSHIRKVQEKRPTNKDDYQDFVSIIILNQNGKEKLEILLNSIKKHEVSVRFEIIIVDNASTDDSVNYIQSMKSDLPIMLICNRENLSFSAANNLAAKQANDNYLLFLNNNTEVTQGWLNELLYTMHNVDNPGAIGAKLVYPKAFDRNTGYKKSYRLQHEGIAFEDTIREKEYFIQPYTMGNGTVLVEHLERPIQRVCVSATLLLVSKKVFWEVDGFDEKYMYEYEDVDLCLKLFKAGYQNYYCPTCFIYHYIFGTLSKDDKKELKIRQRHNMQVFKGKWQRYLSRMLLEDKLDSGCLFTKQRLVIGVVMQESQKQSVTTEHFLEQLNVFGQKKNYDIKLLSSENESDWYDVGVEVDVLIVMTDTFVISDSYNTKQDLIKIARLTGSFGSTEQKNLTDYDFILRENESVEIITDWIKQYNEDIIDAKMIDICGAMPNDDTKKFWGDQHFAVSMKKYFERLGYRANVVSRNEWYKKSKAKYVIVLRGTKAYYPSQNDGRIYIMWNISHPEDVSVEEYNLFDYVFFASNKLQEKLGACIKPKTSVLLQCVDEEVMTYEETKEKEYELLFVGNSRRVYRQILKDLLPTKHSLSVYGRHWDEFPVQQYVVNDYIENEKVGQAYHNAKILLNDHWDDMKEYGIISNRIFDALAVGAFVISDYLPEIEEEFGGIVVTYQTKKDLSEKIDYYLKNEKERLELAQKGREQVLKKHTFEVRCAKIIEVIESFH